MSGKVTKEYDVDGKVHVQNRTNSVLHLDRDPNDPRRNVPAEANLSKLNEEDPEKEPQHQNAVETKE
jgi:hypothetical protein